MGDAPRIREIVERMGGHESRDLGLDLACDEGIGRWWLAACLLSVRAGPAVQRAAFDALADANLADPQALAAAGAAPVARILADAGVPRPEPVAARIARACAAWVERGATSPDRLAADADDAADLVGRLCGLAPGVGPATAVRFLRPLRERWIAAREIPLDPAALVAARHLGILGPGEDEEGEPGALSRALAQEDGGPSLADAEAALARLGRASCRRERPDRCPLGRDCPARA